MKLVKGEGSRETGACWMSAIAWYAGQETWTDKAECVDPLIRSLCVWLNDLLPSDEERERVIGPHIMAPMGTRTDDPDVTRRRRERVVGFAFDAAARAAYDANGAVLGLILDLCAIGTPTEVPQVRSMGELV